MQQTANGSTARKANWMQEFIEQTSYDLEIGEATARSATVGLLAYLHSRIPEGDFRRLQGSLPGSIDPVSAARLRRDSEDLDSGRSGTLAVLGSDMLGSGIQLAGLLRRRGLERSQIGRFVAMFRQYVRNRTEGYLYERLLIQVPAISALAN